VNPKLLVTAAGLLLAACATAPVTAKPCSQ